MSATHAPRRLLVPLWAVMIIVGLAGSANGAEPGVGNTYALEVAGLACPFCAYGIEKRLLKVDGVAGVEVDIGAGRVLVSMEPEASLTRDRAAAAVDEAGFTLRGFEEVRAGADDRAQG